MNHAERKSCFFRLSGVGWVQYENVTFSCFLDFAPAAVYQFLKELFRFAGGFQSRHVRPQEIPSTGAVIMSLDPVART